MVQPIKIDLNEDFYNDIVNKVAEYTKETEDKQSDFQLDYERDVFFKDDELRLAINALSSDYYSQEPKEFFKHKCTVAQYNSLIEFFYEN